MPDFNPDRERGQGTIKYAVRNAHKGLPIKTLQTGKGELKLDKLGRCIIKDAALAAEIRKQYPHDLAVSRVFTQAPADRGHHYFWGSWPEMPWKRKDGDDGHEQSMEGDEGLDEVETFQGEGLE